MKEKHEILKKKLNNYYLIEKQKKIKLPILFGYPYWATIDPTNNCNLSCPLCPTGQKRGSRPAKKLSFSKFKKVIDRIGTYLIHIDFCNWGEPLLNEKIFDMIAYTQKYYIHTKLDTNFNIFNEEKAKNLIESGLDKIILSIDGASQKTYEKYRKGGDFNRVLENVKLLISKRKKLKKNNPMIEWQFLVFKHNQHEMEKAKRIAVDLGVDEINFTPPYGKNLEWLTTIERFRSKYYEVREDKVKFKKPPRKRICNWLWDGLTINSDYSISPCCSVEDKKDNFLDSFSSMPFFFIWNSIKYIQARLHVGNNKNNIKNTSNNICLRCNHIGLSNHIDIKNLGRGVEKKFEAVK